VRPKRERREIDVSGILLLGNERGSACAGVRLLVGYGDVRISGRGEDSFVGRTLWKLLGTGVCSKDDGR
jgi:hypothetical protein